MSNRNHTSSETTESLAISLEEALEYLRNQPILRYKKVPMEIVRFSTMVELEPDMWLFWNNAKAEGKKKGIDVSNLDLGKFMMDVVRSWMAQRGILAGVLKATRLEDEEEDEEEEEDIPLLEEEIQYE